jgi:hypothetical protein
LITSCMLFPSCSSRSGAMNPVCEPPNLIHADDAAVMKITVQTINDNLRERLKARLPAPFCMKKKVSPSSAKWNKPQSKPIAIARIAGVR